jgi:hypothetical protein
MKMKRIKKSQNAVENKCSEVALQGVWNEGRVAWFQGAVLVQAQRSSGWRDEKPARMCTLDSPQAWHCRVMGSW